MAIAVLAATLSGCAGPAPLGPAPSASSTATASSEGSPLATFKAKGFARLDARTEGTVAIHNGCLVLTYGSRAVVPLFPDTDVTWHDGVLTHGGTEYSVGDRIALGGGGTESTLGEVINARIKSSGVNEITAPEGCNDFPVWFA